MNNRERFGAIVRARREELGLSQRAAWQAGGPSAPVWTDIENATGPTLQGRTLSKLDIALRWEPGSARRVLEGQDPIPEGTDVQVQPGFVRMRRVRRDDGSSFVQMNRGDGKGWITRLPAIEAKRLGSSISEALNKLNRSSDLPEPDRLALIAWIEDRQIVDLPERIEALERKDQLKVSRYVDRLLNDYIAAHVHEVDHERAVAMGIIEPTKSDDVAWADDLLDDSGEVNLLKGWIDPTQHAGISGTAVLPEPTQADLGLAADEKRPGSTPVQDARREQDEFFPDDEGPEGGA